MRQIEAFHAIYVSGSISGAARVLNVSQPSLTKVLQHAEQQLGFALFRRVKGRLVATDEAHVLFREVSDVHERLSSLRKTARNLRSGSAGNVRVSVLPALGLDLAPAAIAKLRKAHPGVTFDVMTQHHDEVLRSLYERRCEVAIAYAPAPHPRLKIIELCPAELVLMHRRDAPKVPARIELSWLKGKDIIGLSTSGPVGDLFAAALGKLQVIANEVISAQTFYLAAAMVRHDAGIAIVDEPTAYAMSNAQTDIKFFDPPMRFNVCAIHLEDRPLSQLARAFVQGMREQIVQTQAAHNPAHNRRL
ncbi:LysR family transcriptional regulator [Steroidobacter sp.]|uniref:LysR family transcriptional regulator n=1 Tax=Steroidobacter sp. TaxID=1978227 RepID=UPI001A5E3FF6|nr:LysR family transcriptional regulator [Steroidobacter sp.]MBL8265041.1 LysR family transcriptional regulator [Steroidobacter sp.]